jgi:hypothetical protein
MDTREFTRNQEEPLSHEKQLLVAELQNLETDFTALCNRIGKSRELSLAVTNMEQASMWAVRHLIGHK